MKLSMTLNYSGDPKAAAEQARDLESAGIDVGWVAELYSFDAVSILGYLAAKTETMELGSSILPIYSRTPTLTAMTAAGLDAVSDGRFILGIGASGPQVIEGWHGVPYDRPVGRQRELIEICRKVWRREVVVHDGPSYQLPLPPDQGTGLGKPLKLINHPKRSNIPIYIASLGPSNVATTAEVADGWIPVFFHPDKARSVWSDVLAKGAWPSVIRLWARWRSWPAAWFRFVMSLRRRRFVTAPVSWWRCMWGVWVRGIRTSTTISSVSTAMNKKHTRFRICTFQAVRMRRWLRSLRISLMPRRWSATRAGSGSVWRRMPRLALLVFRSPRLVAIRWPL